MQVSTRKTWDVLEHEIWEVFERHDQTTVLCLAISRTHVKDNFLFGIASYILFSPYCREIEWILPMFNFCSHLVIFWNNCLSIFSLFPSAHLLSPHPPTSLPIEMTPPTPNIFLFFFFFLIKLCLLRIVKVGKKKPYWHWSQADRNPRTAVEQFWLQLDLRGMVSVLVSVNSSAHKNALGMLMQDLLLKMERPSPTADKTRLNL